MIRDNRIGLSQKTSTTMQVIPLQSGPEPPEPSQKKLLERIRDGKKVP